MKADFIEAETKKSKPDLGSEALPLMEFCDRPANFALAMRLAEAKDVGKAIELQSEHLRKQMEGFVHQLEEMRDLTAQLIQEAHPATRTDVSSVRSAPFVAGEAKSGQGGGASFAAYAPASSVTPGKTGLGY